MNDIKTLEDWIKNSRNLVFFGGAGVSTESGIPDFRSTNGLYQQKYPYPPEVMLSHSFYVQHPEEFYAFYRDKMLYPKASPNKAHLVLAKWEREGLLEGIITQNIDGLHQAAGSQKVFELHGSVHRNICQKCGRNYGLEAVLHSSGIPRCSCGGVLKPDVVLYEEPLPQQAWTGAMGLVSAADVMIVGGTSLSVYPAAALLDYYKGSRLVLINKSPTPRDREAALLLSGSIGELLGSLSV